jgi:hypothetical protein
MAAELRYGLLVSDAFTSRPPTSRLNVSISDGVEISDERLYSRNEAPRRSRQSDHVDADRYLGHVLFVELATFFVMSSNRPHVSVPGPNVVGGRGNRNMCAEFLIITGASVLSVLDAAKCQDVLK